MYGQKNHLKEAVQPVSYVCDMLLRERMNPYWFLVYSRVFILLA